MFLKARLWLCFVLLTFMLLLTACAGKKGGFDLHGSPETELATGTTRCKMWVVERALKRGANINYVYKDGRTPLGYAILSGCDEAIRLLLKNGADINLSFKGYGDRPNYPAELLSNGPEDKFFDFLRLSKNKLSEDSLKAVLRNACMRGKMKIVWWAINEKKIDPNIRFSNGNTPLIVAATNGHAGIVKFLIRKGADPKIQNEKGYTALDYAEKYQEMEVIDILSKY